MRLKDRIAIVTGAGQGIGRAIVLNYAKEGVHTVVCDKDEEKANSVSEEVKSLGQKTLAVKVDVGRQDEVNHAVKKAIKEFGKIDILVNNAGIIKSGIQIHILSEEDWDNVIETNLKGTFLFSQAVGREMIKNKGGCIINISSIGGITPSVFCGAYSASKAGVILLSKQLAMEWVNHDIRVNVICPGNVLTPMTNHLYKNDILTRKRLNKIPMKRFAEPEEIAKVAVFLASDDSSYITGQAIIVDGGGLESYNLL